VVHTTDKKKWQNVKEGGHLENPEKDGKDNIKVDLIK
jgi:hypothetical protein